MRSSAGTDPSNAASDAAPSAGAGAGAGGGRAKRTVMNFAYGAASGLVTAAVLQPFDVVRTRVQGEESSLRASWKSVVDKDGVKGLWMRGLAPTLLRAAIGPGVFFSIVSSMHANAAWREALGSSSEFVVGAVARSIASVIVAPLTLIKARQEWGLADAAPRSLRGAFVGLAPTLARDVPFSGIHLYFYMALKPADGSAAVNAAANFAAGCVATLVTHPFDVIRTRQQINGPRITRARELLSGFSLRMVKRPLTTAVAWIIYEALEV